MPKLIFLIVILMLSSGCGSKNLFDCDGGRLKPCSEPSKFEKARRSLEAGDADTAINLLEELIKEEPENYSHYPLLGASYAFKGGIDVLNVTQGGFSGGGSFLDTIGQFLPDPKVLTTDEYKTKLKSVNRAVEVLLSIPEASRKSTSENAYGASAALQLTIYQSSYSIMYLNQFIAPPSDPTSTQAIDLDKLKTMSDEDAKVIIDSLVTAAVNSPEGQGAGAEAKINETLGKIDQEPGSSQREKLISYVEKTKK